ncbi:hypothetical protein RB195_024484 [Necator americanus]
MYRDNHVLSYRGCRPFFSAIKATKCGRAIYSIHDGESYRLSASSKCFVYGVSSSRCLRQTDFDVEEDALVNGAEVFVSGTLYRTIVPTAESTTILKFLDCESKSARLNTVRVRVLALTIHMATGRLPVHPALVVISVKTKWTRDGKI